MQIDYYFSVLSPFAYLAGDRLERIAAQRGATVAYKPLDILALFDATGGTPPKQRHPARQAYRAQELPRLAARLGMPLNLQPAHWPTDQKPASAMIEAAQLAGEDAGALAQAVLRAVWAEEKEIADPDVVAGLVQGCGIDLGALAPHLEQAVALFDRRLEEAQAAGAFGSPFYVTGDGARFFGQDRLDHLDDHLAA